MASLAEIVLRGCGVSEPAPWLPLRDDDTVGVDPDMIREYFVEDCDEVKNRGFQRTISRLSRLATTERRLS